MSDVPIQVDLAKMRRHVAEFQVAWNRAESEPRATELRMTLAAVMCAEDLATLLQALDEGLPWFGPIPAQAVKETPDHA